MKTLELHLIQSFAPSNLNRDDTGSPKDAFFGGVRRARISSQALKRAGRLHFREGGVLHSDELGERTKRLSDEIASLLINGGRDGTEAQTAARLAVTTLMKGSTEVRDGQDGADTHMTKFLMFVSRREITALVEAINTHWEEMLAEASSTQTAPKKKGKGKGADQEDSAPAGLDKSSDAGKAIGQLLQNRALLSADVAMFGRMVATDHAYSVDAAVQVAHALGTHALRDRQFDFYTAVDDLKSDAEMGADMMGTVEFNSAVVYRYVNVDLLKLLENLNGDTDLAARSVQALIEATVEALPTGKQNTFAAHNMPSLVAAEVRPSGAPRSLANAFLRPVGQTAGGDLIAESSDRLAQEWSRQGRIFGHTGQAHVLNAHDQAVGGLPEDSTEHGSVATLVEGVMRDVRALLGAGAG